jgi:hypothetical protein
VHYALLVRILERGGHLVRDRQRIVERKLVLTLEPLPQRLALDPGHHVVQKASGLTRVEEREDVGVLEVGGGLDLREEALRAEHGSQLGLQHLDGDLAVVLRVFGQVHGGHAALAERALDAVAVGEGVGQAGGQVGHWRRQDVTPPCFVPGPRSAQDAGLMGRSSPDERPLAGR